MPHRSPSSIKPPAPGETARSAWVSSCAAGEQLPSSVTLPPPQGCLLSTLPFYFSRYLSSLPLFILSIFSSSSFISSLLCLENHHVRAGEKTPGVKRLLANPEDSRSDLQHPHVKLNVVVQACKPSSGEAEIGRSQGLASYPA